MKLKPITIIGVGMSVEDLTDKQKAVIRNADVLMGGERNLSHVTDFSGERIVIKNVRQTVEYIRSEMKDKRIVVLASGDPLFFGIGEMIVQSVGMEHIDILPNVSSVAAAFSRIGESWSHAAIVSLHGRDNESALFRALRRNDKVAVFTDPMRTPAWLAERLIEKGFTEWRLGVFERLGQPDEKTGWHTPAEAAGLAFGEPNVVILKRDPEAEAYPAIHPGMPEDDFEHDRGMITKPEIRAVVLSKLRMKPSHVLWDLGAGSGSVSIEASEFLDAGMVFAVEKDAERIVRIKANIARFRAVNVETVQAVLPDGLDLLPAPDRIFVGGGGKHLAKIIETAASFLKSGGIMVVNTVLIDNLGPAMAAFRDLGFQTETIQIQINRSRPMPWSDRFEAQNQVWIITGIRNPNIEIRNKFECSKHCSWL